MSDDGDERDDRDGSVSDGSEGDKKIVTYDSRSKDHDRSESRSPSLPKNKKERYSRSRSRSRSHRKSRRSSRYRSRSRSPRRTSRRYTRSRSYSRSRSASVGYHRRRSHSRSPWSDRRRHNGNRSDSRFQDKPRPNKCLGVFGLDVRTTEDQILHIFQKYGKVERAQVIYDAKSGRSRGFGFVYFENLEDARLAREECSGMEIDCKEIRVDYSITTRPHTPTPGMYLGKSTYSDDRYRRDREYYGSSYRGSRFRSPSPYSSRRRRDRSRSRSYSERRY